VRIITKLAKHFRSFEMRKKLYNVILNFQNTEAMTSEKNKYVSKCLSGIIYQIKEFHKEQIIEFFVRRFCRMDHSVNLQYRLTHFLIIYF